MLEDGPNYGKTASGEMNNETVSFIQNRFVVYRNFIPKELINFAMDTWKTIEETSEYVLTSNLESPDSFAIRKELSGIIQEALLNLPEDQRLALILVDVQGMSYEETSTILDTPIGTVKSRLSRARESVRLQLVEQRELLPAQFR